VETDPTVMCQLLVGLPTVTVLGVVDEGVDTPLMGLFGFERGHGVTVASLVQSGLPA
jgi:hypothetical protein